MPFATPCQVEGWPASLVLARVAGDESLVVVSEKLVVAETGIPVPAPAPPVPPRVRYRVCIFSKDAPSPGEPPPASETVHQHTKFPIDPESALSMA